MSSNTYNISIGAQPPSTVIAGLDRDARSTSPAAGGVTAGNAAMLKQVMDGAFADGKFDENDLAAMNSVLGKSSDAGSAGVASPKADDMTDQAFMKAVDDIAGQSEPGIGPGEKMMRKEAQRLVDGGGTAADKQAFLDEANKLLNNADSDGKDIDEVNDGEGTKLAGFTDALLGDKSDSSSTDGSGSTRKSPVSDFLSKAYADGKLSDTELQGLQSLMGAVAASDPSSGGSSTSNRSADFGAKNAAIDSSSNYTYNDSVRSFIQANMEKNLINNDSGKLALSYIDDDANV
jgi:hypothetical protein